MQTKTEPLTANGDYGHMVQSHLKHARKTPLPRTFRMFSWTTSIPHLTKSWQVEGKVDAAFVNIYYYWETKLCSSNIRVKFLAEN
jgi:hypothetical protein